MSKDNKIQSQTAPTRPRGGNEEKLEATVSFNEPVVKEAEVPRPQNTKIAPQFEKEVSKVDADKQAEANKVSVSLTNYEDLFTKATSQAEVAKANTYLFNVLKAILRNKSQVNFRTQWNEVLNFVNKSAVINELTVFQGSYNWELTQTAFDVYRSVMTLIFASANPATRYKLDGRIQMTTLLPTVGRVGEDARRNLSNFYSY